MNNLLPGNAFFFYFFKHGRRVEASGQMSNQKALFIGDLERW
jgi:hypothetical protein